MSKKENWLIETWDEADFKDVSFTIEEDFSESVVKPVSKSNIHENFILARASGPSFVPGGLSRNKRLYPEGLWENQLKRKDLKQKIQDRLLFGCVGHKSAPVTEDDIASGNFSHVVTNMWIDEKTGLGMANYEIVDTTQGRILNNLMRTGSKFKVSTRATGEYLKDKTTNEGYPIVDKDKFDFRTIDFVISPGFEQVNVTIEDSAYNRKFNKSESLKDSENLNYLTETNKGAPKMAENEYKELYTEQREENKKLVSKIALLEDAYRKLEGESESLKSNFNALSEENADLSVKLAELSLKEHLNENENDFSDKIARKGFANTQEFLEFIETFDSKTLNELKRSGSIRSILETYNNYKRFGDYEEFVENLNESRKLLEDYTEVTAGTEPDDLREMFEFYTNLMIEYMELGKPEEVSEAFDALEQRIQVAESLIDDYLQIGEPERIQNVLESAVERLTRFEEASKQAYAQLMEYKQIGSVEDFKNFKTLSEEYFSEMRHNEAKDLSKNYNVEYDQALDILNNSASLTEAKSILESVSSTPRFGREETVVLNEEAKDFRPKYATLAGEIMNEAYLVRQENTAPKKAGLPFELEADSLYK